MEKWIADTLPDNEKRKKLKSVCKTRWVERHEAFEVFLDLFIPVVCCLEDIKNASCDDWSQETRRDALSYFIALTQFPFIFALSVTKEVLGYTKALSVKLQGRYVDVVKAFVEINTVKKTLNNARIGISQFHGRVYSLAVELAKVVDVGESVPRTTGRQQHRCNVPSSSPSEYFMRQLTIPALDYLISEINSRFTSALSSAIIQIKVLLPSTLTERTQILTAAEIPDLISFYNDDLPSPASLDAELHCWGVKWADVEVRQQAKALNNPRKTLAIIDSDFFPNIKVLITIACTIAVTSAECERSISRLRYLKNPMRSTMRQKRLNDLAMLYVNRDIACCPNIVVDQFARKHPRRMCLVNPLLGDDD